MSKSTTAATWPRILLAFLICVGACAITFAVTRTAYIGRFSDDYMVFERTDRGQSEANREYTGTLIPEDTPKQQFVLFVDSSGAAMDATLVLWPDDVPQPMMTVELLDHLNPSRHFFDLNTGSGAWGALDLDGDRLVDVLQGPVQETTQAVHLFPTKGRFISGELTSDRTATIDGVEYSLLNSVWHQE